MTGAPISSKRHTRSTSVLDHLSKIDISRSPISNLKSHLSILLLFLLIIMYTLYFSWYTINRHNTLNSYAADLSLIDQPMWNTVRGPGGFMELTWGDHQQPRLAEHFEPILVPLALLFFLWDDVRILLIAQSLALAIGALPVFWIAREQLSIAKSPTTALRAGASVTGHQSLIPNGAALTFSVVYLLSPHLQAANIADFHADPLVVTPLLFAFWYATQKRWGWMWLWAIVATSTKETLPTLTAMLGVWLLLRIYWQARQGMKNEHTANHGNAVGPAPYGRKTGSQPSSLWPQDRRSAVIFTAQGRHALILILVSTIWFLVATFLIVAPLARQYFGTDGPIYFANRYSGGLPNLLQDSARWRYLFGLFAAVGFLPMLAPDLLILGLPVLVANLLSNFPGQYSGEQHYSAPLVAAFMIAAIYGTRRLMNNISLHENRVGPSQTIALLAIMLWLLAWSLGYQANRGWTPLSTRKEIYQPSPASTILHDFTAQIPSEATVTASAAVHPHLAHRRIIYIFPTVQDADYMLVDVTDIPGTHPNDVKTQILSMLNDDYRLLQADHGVFLAQRVRNDTFPAALLLPCSPALLFPCSFYDFARTVASPTYPATLTFGDDQLQLLGYDVHDDPDDGLTFRFYWQAFATLPENLRLWPLIYDDLGQLLNDPRQVPMIATLWYPPTAWQTDEIIVTETLPQLLPDTFHLGVAVGLENSFAAPADRFPMASQASPETILYPGSWAQLGTFRRQGPFLIRLPATRSLHPFQPADVQFGPAIHLTGFWFEKDNLYPGSPLPVLLQWTSSHVPRADFTVFVHLVSPDGQLVAQSDAFPTWLTPVPTSQWLPNQPQLDSHILALPEDLPPATYALELGLYDFQTFERLPLAEDGNAFRLGQIQVR